MSPSSSQSLDLPRPDAAPGIGAVALRVRDLDRAARFYETAIGLEPLSDERGRVVMGAGGRVLLILAGDPSLEPARPGVAGLFHTAFLLPDRVALARWLRHVAALDVRLEGASDHLVSEAIYLSDPEGNGIEVYADRPRAAWVWNDGEVRMATQPLDLAALAGAADGEWDRAPDGTCVGHIHLRVGDTAAAEDFYGGVLGLDIVCRFPGAAFLSRDGYHHHVGANVWQSRGAGRRRPGQAGLDHFELRLEPGVLAGARARLAAAGQPDGGTAEDPWGTRVVLRETA